MNMKDFQNYSYIMFNFINLIFAIILNTWIMILIVKVYITFFKLNKIIITNYCFFLSLISLIFFSH